MRVIATESDLLVLVEQRGGASEYHWSSHLRPDPLVNATFEAIRVGWNASRGRCIFTTMQIKRGELLMREPALAHVAFSKATSARGTGTAGLDEYGLDEPTIQLAVKAAGRQSGRQLVTALSASRDEDVRTLGVVASRLRTSGRLPPHLSGLTDALLGQLFLRIKCNLHVSHDDDTAAAATGVGLYPAAALLNHDCVPCACFSWTDGGRYMNVHALRDLTAGEEVTCSYLTDEQLYAPWEERQALLREAFQFEPVEPPLRAEAERAAQGKVSGALAQQARRLIGAAHRSLAGGGEAGGGEAGSRAAAEEAAGELVEFVESRLQGTLHPFHALVQEAHAALLAVARRIEEPMLVARTALHLIAAREAMLPVGTPHLASLYASHGSALCTVLREGGLASDQERRDVAKGALRSLTASHRIREYCLGAKHPLTVATAAAVQHASDTSAF